jgi:polysaccharide export outer membrane protein
MLGTELSGDLWDTVLTVESIFRVGSVRTSFVALCAVGILSGCGAHLPKGGPDAAKIRAEAVVYRPAAAGPAKDYALIDITDSILGYFEVAQTPGLDATFGSGGGGAPELRLGVGDVVQITLFESSAGGLFIPSEAGSRPGNFISIPQQTVDASGQITVPYAGRIDVAGRTPEDVEAAIRAALADRAIEPQAVLTLAQSRANEVSVLGDVNDPDKFAINPGGERVLDLISRGGGVSVPAREAYVTLQRGGRTSTVYLQHLLTNPRENIFVRPGDIIFVNRDQRTYTAFGATGLNGRFEFENSNLNVAEAMGQAGGVLDSRAEPANVYIYRMVSAELAQKLGLPISAKDTGEFPVIFRLNLRDPSGFFLARKFALQDRDVLYIDNATSIEYLKVMEIVNATTSSTLGTAAQVRVLTR